MNIFRRNVLSEAKVDHNEFTLWLRVFYLNVGIAQALAIKALHNWIQYQVSKQSKTNLFDSGLAGTLCAIEILRNKETLFHVQTMTLTVANESRRRADEKQGKS